MLNQVLLVLRERRELIVSAVTVLAAMFVFVLLTYHRASYITLMFHDNFIFMDGAHRLGAGQLPNIDFFTPAGALFYLIPLLGLTLTGSYGASMPMAMGVTTIIAAPLIAYVVTTRFRYYWFAVPISLYLILVLGGPTVLGWNPFGITMAMWYNRLGWVLICLLFILYLPPNIRYSYSRWADALVIFAINVVCFYLKMTYFSVSISFSVLLFLIQKERRFPVVVGFGLLVAFIACVELRWGIHKAYLTDLLQAIKVSGALRHGSSNGAIIGMIKPLIVPVVRSLPEVAMVFFAIVFLLLARKLTWRDAVFFSFVLGSSAAIFNQNAQTSHWPPIVVLLGYAAQRSFELPGSGSKEYWWVAPFGVGALLMVFLVEPFYRQATALAQHFKHTGRISRTQDMPNALAMFNVDDPELRATVEREPKISKYVEGGEFDRLRVYHNPYQSLYQTEYLRTVIDGVTALAAFNDPSKRIITLDFVNPFSFILDHVPAKGDASFLHNGRSFDRNTHIPPSILFGHADLVMVPKRPVTPISYDVLIEVYKEELEKRFFPVKETKYWTVWSKREPL